MNNEHIQDAKEIAEKRGFDRVIIIGIDQKKGIFRTSSYGKTATLCSKAKVTCDFIHSLIESGCVPIDIQESDFRRTK